FYSGFENGRGLGMSIVRKIVDDYDGRIDVRSELNKGAEVLITLPVRRPAGA
ncbi:MAG: ATP-binding protein, partial [Acidobacteria bacterium]|nr:ATP-binding protein [Acidobacteriota bacterium]